MNVRALTAAFLLIGFTSHANAKLEVHEWGTFTSLVGSNGITQNGMYHEDEPLPDFVYGFGEIVTPIVQRPTPRPSPLPPPTDRQRPCRSKACFADEFLNQNVITQKMETPVLYFYSDQPVDVDVNVKFPDGLITETYPGPVLSSPSRADLKTASGGEATFKIRVLNDTIGKLPTVAADNIYGHARDVASNVVTNRVRNGTENEKFIFYRGLGRYSPQFQIESNQGNLSVTGYLSKLPKHAYLVDVSADGHARLMKLVHYCGGLYEVPSAQINLLRDHSRNPVDESAGIFQDGNATSEIVTGLVASGLNQDEAEAMIKTWEHGYLKVPGLRLLSILPRAEVDMILPLTISPTPEHVERVFVSRIEVLLDTDETALLNRVSRETRNLNVATLGRFAESMLRRVRDVCLSKGACDALRRGDGGLTSVFDDLIMRASRSSLASATGATQF